MSRESPAHVRPVTPTHVPLPPLYLRPRFLTCSCSASNVLNHHASMYLARLIASNQAYSQLLCRFRDTTFDPLPTGIVLPDRSRAAVLWPHCNDCIAGSYTTAGCEAGSNTSTVVCRYNRKGTRARTALRFNLMASILLLH